MSIPGLILDLMKFCQTNDRLFEDRAPFLSIQLTCSFNDTNFEASEVPFDLGTRGNNVPRFEPRTSSSGCKNIID